MAVRRVVRRKTTATKPAAPARSRSTAPNGSSGTKTAPKAPAARRTAPRGATAASKRTADANGQAKPTTKGRYGGTTDTMPRGGGGLWSMPNEGMQVRFLGEPTETDKCPGNAAIWWFEEWYHPELRKFGILEPGEPPPEGARKSTRLVAAVWDRGGKGDGEQLKYLKLPGSLLDPINKYFARYGSICDADAYLSKEGANINTRYHIEFERQDDPIPAKKLAKIREGLDVGGALEAEAERLINMPDRPREKKTLRELRTMDLEAFKLHAKSLGLVTKGKKRSELVEEIMEAQVD